MDLAGLWLFIVRVKNGPGQARTSISVQKPIPIQQVLGRSTYYQRGIVTFCSYWSVLCTNLDICVIVNRPYMTKRLVMLRYVKLKRIWGHYLMSTVSCILAFNQVMKLSLNYNNLCFHAERKERHIWLMCNKKLVKMVEPQRMRLIDTWLRHPRTSMVT